MNNSNGKLQKIPKLGELTNVQNCIPTSIRNTSIEQNNIGFVLIFHKMLFLYLNGGLDRINFFSSIKLQALQAMQYEKAPSVLFSDYIIFELEYDDRNNTLTDEELDIVLDLKFDEKK